MSVAQRIGRGQHTLNDGAFPAGLAAAVSDAMPEMAGGVSACATPCSTFPAQPRALTVEVIDDQKVTYRALSASGQRVILQDWPSKSAESARVQRGKADAQHASTPYLNPIINPSFETGIAGWSSSGANAITSGTSMSWQPSGGIVGAGWLRGDFTATGISDNLYNQLMGPTVPTDVTVGEQYYIHVRIKGLTPMKWLQFLVDARTAANVTINNRPPAGDEFYVEDPEVGKWYDLYGLYTVSNAVAPNVATIRPIPEAFASAPGPGAWAVDAVSMVKVSDPDDTPRY